MMKIIEKYNIDIGQAFGVFYFVTMLEQFYEMVCEMLFMNHFSFNIGIIISFYLAKGMYTHTPSSRKWTLGFAYVGWALFTIFVIISPLVGGISFTVADKEFTEPEFYKLFTIYVLMSPVFFFAIKLLNSEKAKKEFDLTNHST